MSKYKTKCKASGNIIEFDRQVGEAGDPTKGPTLAFVLGLHGNEPTGLEAFVNVLNELDKGKYEFGGRIVGFAGNTNALEEGNRFIDSDMNRGWIDSELEKDGNEKELKEKNELKELIEKTQQNTEKEGNKFYLFDLHTTSAESVPFSIINESHTANIKIAKEIPCAKIISMYPYQFATMTDYWNSKGMTSYLFEGGQHDDQSSIENHESFIWCNLFATGILDVNKYEEKYIHHNNRLGRFTKKDNPFYRTSYCHKTEDGDGFEMIPGYTNLHFIKKGEVIAKDKDGEIKAEMEGNIFMPRYQKQGNDGFFIVKKTTDLSVLE